MMHAKLPSASFLTRFSFYILSFVLSFHTVYAADIIEEWTDFSNTTIQAPQKGVSSVVIYRPKEGIAGPAVNVYIDGEYQASLLSDAYTQAPVCGGKHNLMVAYTNILTQYKEKKRVGKKIEPKANQISYYRLVSNSDKTMSLEEVSEPQALAQIKKLTVRQNHTIPRISQRNCDKPVQMMLTNAKVSGQPASSVLSISNK